MIADSGTGLAWLRWVSPLGWVEELQPLTSPEPLMLLPIAALIATMAGLAIHLAGSRDLGASVIADRTHAVARTRLLSGPTGLAIRLTRWVVIAWGISIALLSLMMGLIAKSVGNVLSENAGDRETFAKLGIRGSGAAQYLAITFLIVALLIALIAAGQLSAARGEEADGRIDHLLVRQVSRYTWLGGRLAVATGCLVIGGPHRRRDLAGSARPASAAVSGSATLLGAGLNVVPPAVFILGARERSTFGARPRAVSAVTYGLLAWSFLVELIGGIAGASHWVLDTVAVSSDVGGSGGQSQLDKWRCHDAARCRRRWPRRGRFPPPRSGRRMSARRVDPKQRPDWRQLFVEELGVLAFDVGAPRATVRVLGWLVVCDPPEQSAPEIQSALQLSAGAVSAATRTLIGIGMLERVAHPADRHMYYKVRAGGWEVAMRSRLRTLVGIREVADRALLAATDDTHRLRDMRDMYAWFEDRLDELLAQRATTPTRPASTPTGTGRSSSRRARRGPTAAASPS